MQKIETIKVKRDQVKHQFYCDHCNIYLGETIEYDDGYYPELGEFELSFHTPSGWYRINKCLCDTCRNKLLTEIENTLVSLGFKLQ